MTRPCVLLAILDGWGVGNYDKGNAIKKAHTPTFDYLDQHYPPSKIHAYGEHVGLPIGQMGNSEVGHLNLGAGRVVLQDLPRISQAIKDQSFFENPALKKATRHALSSNSSLHLIGLVSDGGVHSHLEHLYALLELAKKNHCKKVFIHALLDGRDTPPQSAIVYLERLLNKMDSLGVGKISTVMGRYYGMDRDNRWNRVEKAYNAMVHGKPSLRDFINPRYVENRRSNGAQGFTQNPCFHGKGKKIDVDILNTIAESYRNNINDEFVVPTIVNPLDKDSLIKNEDSVIFFNFRADRVREITKTFIDPEFDKFLRPAFIKPYITCMTEYDENFHLPVAFSPFTPKNGLGEILSQHNLQQIRIAETEKYAHVTFFFNGGTETPFEGEDRKLIPSPGVATYDLKPEMSAYEVKEEVIKALTSQKYDFILVNFANPDMVGHTGFLDAAIKAVETIDTCIGEIFKTVKDLKADFIITADHGNAEEMINPEDDSPVTAHTTNLVPLYCILNRDAVVKKEGILADIAPTALKLMGLDPPSEMTGKSLVSFK